MSKLGGQGRRARRKSIRSLRPGIALHEAKIAENPDHPARPHREAELTAVRVHVEKHQRRLGRG